MRKRTLIINDTSRECHHGCDVVMRNIKTLCFDNSSSIVWSICSDNISDPDRLFVDYPCDLVIVNGEGTIHHSQPRAKFIAEVIRSGVSNNIPVYIINSTIQDNDDSILEALSMAKSVFVREPGSHDYLSSYGIRSSIVPDLSFYSEYATNDYLQRRGVGVTDSVSVELSKKLFQYASQNSYEFLPILRDPEIEFDGLINGLRFLKFRSLKKIALLSKFCGDMAEYDIARFAYYFDNYERYIDSIAKFDFLITARFHSMCFSIKTLTPFVALSSNTHKMESLMIHIGISPERIISAERLSSDLKFEYLPFSVLEKENISHYVSGAKIKISRMFDFIFG